jgi:hypothetical protein
VKLVMTLLVRNEADIIETNLDYHLAQGVDFVIVTDHNSSDGTSELLRPYERERVAIVLREEGDEHHQSERVTRMARLALAEHSADWVIHNDADEFWWPLSGSLRDVFAAIPADYGQIVVRRRNFLPRPAGPEAFYSRLIYRECESLNPIGHPLEPKVAHRPNASVVVAPGNHWISGAALRATPTGEMLEVFHFPMRSYDQFERKVVQTGVGYEKLAHRSPDVGRDQLKLLQVYRENGLRRYYDDALLDENALQGAVGDGRVVMDRRLAEFMNTLPERRLQPERPDGPATRALVSNSLSASLELEAGRAKLSETQAALTQAHDALAHTQAALAATRDELSAVSETLQLVRESRIMRWTAPLRRVWYRCKQSLRR